MIMTDLGKLAEKVYQKIEWQKLPPTYSNKDKQLMILNALVEAIQDLFVVTGRAYQYSDYTIIYEDVTESGETYSVPSEFDYDFVLDEELYILCRAQISIFEKIRAQYNDLLGYSTNALTVTNADKPYAYITGTIGELENRMRRYYYKMVRYSHLG